MMIELLRVYLSHPIRGANRVTSKESEKPIMDVNISKALAMGQAIRSYCPFASLYIPGEHEEFVNRAYEKYYLIEPTILEIDCDIIRSSDCVLFYNHENKFSSGMHAEWTVVNEEKVPSFTFNNVENSLGSIKAFLEKVWNDKQRDSQSI